MLLTEIIAVYFKNDTKPINILCGQNSEMMSVKAGGTYGYHYTLKSSKPLSKHLSVWRVTRYLHIVTTLLKTVKLEASVTLGVF
jgi:hypothetical protein